MTKILVARGNAYGVHRGAAALSLDGNEILIAKFSVWPREVGQGEDCSCHGFQGEHCNRCLFHL